MARIRTIKPSFFESEDVAVLPLRARLLWIGLWTHCDDEGRTKDNTKLIKARIWPLDQVSLRDIDEDLETLAGYGRITRYEVDGQHYLAVVNWHEHQSINKPTPSRIPPPPPTSASGKPPTPVPSDSGNAPVGLPDGSRLEGKGKERKGGDAREPRDTTRTAGEAPPIRCPQHEDNPNPPPCGACADARKAHQARAEWLKREAADARAELARQQAETKRAAIDNCELCNSRGYVGGFLCAHDPGQAQRATAGAAAARAQIRSPKGQ